jgi:hypothetical protein
MARKADYKLTKEKRKQRVMLTKKELEKIDQRRLYALRLNDYYDIMDAKYKVLSIIDREGLDSDNKKVKLDTAFKLLPYILPQKRAIDMQVTAVKIEDLIKSELKTQVQDTDFDILPEPNTRETGQKQAESEENSENNED